jgi:hypothetical protein
MMKKGMPWVIIFLLVMSMALSVNAFGASDTPTLVYVPTMSDPVELTPGEAAQVPMAVELENGNFVPPPQVTFVGDYVTYLKSEEVKEGNNPFTVTAVGMPIGALSPQASTALRVQASENAQPGTYTVVVTSSVYVPDGSVVDLGSGFAIDVTVVGQSETEPQCAAPPTVRITQSEPEVVWTPNKEMVEVTIKGTVDPGENCTLDNVGYTVDDEYEEFNTEKTATVEPDGRLLAPDNLTMDVDGNVTLKVTVEASRHGGDENGRNYGIRLTAANEEGSGKSQLVTVTVSHDQGKQKEAKR